VDECLRNPKGNNNSNNSALFHLFAQVVERL